MVNWIRIALVVVFAFGAVACGSDDEDEEELTIASADTCEQLADAFMPLMQEILDNVSDMSLADMMSDEEPEFLRDMEDRVTEAENKSDELGCDDEMETLVGQRLDQLTAEGEVGEMFLMVLQEEFN